MTSEHVVGALYISYLEMQANQQKLVEKNKELEQQLANAHQMIRIYEQESRVSASAPSFGPPDAEGPQQ